jgi:lipoprotein-releasing system permease protein
MAEIRSLVGDRIVGMSPTVHVPALMTLNVGGEQLVRQVTLVGVDEATHASVSAFGDYLQHPANREKLHFGLRESGYDAIDHQLDDPADAKPREQMRSAGWGYRRYKAMIIKQRAAQQRLATEQAAPAAAAPDAPAEGEASDESGVTNPFATAAPNEEPEGRDWDPAIDEYPGVVVGIGVCSYRTPDGSDYFLNMPGDDVKVSFPLATMPPKVTSVDLTVVDFYESKMAEYDSNFAFMPLRRLQECRNMIDPTTGVGKFTSIQIKLKPGVDADAVRDRLQAAFPRDMYIVSTWRDKQGPLLAAVQMETAVLNVLLFMIIAVAGFGILAIFFLIVVEKTRDIGIMKSLGASAWGVMGIFLAYGLSLGLVGAGAGTGLGLLFVAKINEVADLLGEITGQPVFDPAVYYFPRIPTIVEPFTVAWIVAGSIGIAVLASVLPAIRAATLHPVKALRFG